jgi:hypothetical protein
MSKDHPFKVSCNHPRTSFSSASVDKAGLTAHLPSSLTSYPPTLPRPPSPHSPSSIAVHYPIYLISDARGRRADETPTSNPTRHAHAQSLELLRASHPLSPYLSTIAPNDTDTIPLSSSCNVTMSSRRDMVFSSNL